MKDEKLRNLIKYSIDTFQNNRAEDALINARKTMEAFCKVIILDFFGEERGKKIIFSQDSDFNEKLNISSSQKKAKNEFVLSMLIKVVLQSLIVKSCYENKYSGKELSNNTRSRKIWLERKFDSIVFDGNSSAHESSSIQMDNTDMDTIKNNVFKLLTWLFDEYLKEEIPDELIPYIKRYDIFISYRHTDIKWTELLINNLEAQGFTLFVDKHQIQGGNNIHQRIRDGIKKSRNAIIIYPKEENSQWIEKELEWMKERQENDASFKIIPIIMYSSVQVHYDNIAYIDFKGKEYNQAFNELVCSIKGFSLTSNCTKEELIQQPTFSDPIADNTFSKEVLEKIDYKRFIALFSQDYVHIEEYYNTIKEEVKSKFLKQFYSVTIPSFVNDRAKYFNALAKCCNIEEPIENAGEWKDSMSNKLQQSHNNIMLFVTDLEDGNSELNREFATVLRSLHDKHKNLYALFIGRKELARLVFSKKELSPLDIVERVFFPNAHVIIESEDIVLQFEKIREEKNYLCELLTKERLILYSPWSGDELINNLYWKNLLIRDNNYLVWKSNEIRKIGQEVLACENE